MRLAVRAGTRAARVPATTPRTTTPSTRSGAQGDRPSGPVGGAVDDHGPAGVHEDGGDGAADETQAACPGAGRRGPGRRGRRRRWPACRGRAAGGGPRWRRRPSRSWPRSRWRWPRPAAPITIASLVGGGVLSRRGRRPRVDRSPVRGAGVGGPVQVEHLGRDPARCRCRGAGSGLGDPVVAADRPGPPRPSDRRSVVGVDDADDLQLDPAWRSTSRRSPTSRPAASARPGDTTASRRVVGSRPSTRSTSDASGTKPTTETGMRSSRPGPPAAVVQSWMRKPVSTRVAPADRGRAPEAGVEAGELVGPGQLRARRSGRRRRRASDLVSTERQSDGRALGGQDRQGDDHDDEGRADPVPSDLAPRQPGRHPPPAHAHPPPFTVRPRPGARGRRGTPRRRGHRCR